MTLSSPGESKRARANCYKTGFLEGSRRAWGGRPTVKLGHHFPGEAGKSPHDPIKEGHWLSATPPPSQGSTSVSPGVLQLPTQNPFLAPTHLRCAPTLPFSKACFNCSNHSHMGIVGRVCGSSHSVGHRAMKQHRTSATPGLLLLEGQFRVLHRKWHVALFVLTGGYISNQKSLQEIKKTPLPLV